MKHDVAFAALLQRLHCTWLICPSSTELHRPYPAPRPAEHVHEGAFRGGRPDPIRAGSANPLSTGSPNSPTCWRSPAAGGFVRPWSP